MKNRRTINEREAGMKKVFKVVNNHSTPATETFYSSASKASDHVAEVAERMMSFGVIRVQGGLFKRTPMPHELRNILLCDSYVIVTRGARRISAVEIEVL